MTNILDVFTDRFIFCLIIVKVPQQLRRFQLLFRIIQIQQGLDLIFLLRRFRRLYSVMGQVSFPKTHITPYHAATRS